MLTLSLGAEAAAQPTAPTAESIEELRRKLTHGEATAPADAASQWTQYTNKSAADTSDDSLTDKFKALPTWAKVGIGAVGVLGVVGIVRAVI